MTQNHQCMSNQKIQTACPYGRVNRSVGQAVFFALNDGQTGQFTVRIKVDFGHFFRCKRLLKGLPYSDSDPEKHHSEGKSGVSPSLHMRNIHTWKIQMWQIHTWRNHTGKIPHNKILNKEILKNQVTIELNINLSILMTVFCGLIPYQRLGVVLHFPISLWRTSRFFFETLSKVAYLVKPNSSGNISDEFIRFFQKLRGF